VSLVEALRHSYHGGVVFTPHSNPPVDRVIVLCYNTRTLKGVEMTIKEQILTKLAEIEKLLLEAECDGAQLAELECFKDVDMAVAHLAQTVDYYID